MRVIHELISSLNRLAAVGESLVNQNAAACHKSHVEAATKQDLEQLGHMLLKALRMTQTELDAQLKLMVAQVGKISAEQSTRFDTLTQTIADLTATINAGGAVTPEVTADLAAVQSALDALDATIPDAPAPPVA
jgi:oligoendopeptidase F